MTYHFYYRIKSLWLNRRFRRLAMIASFICLLIFILWYIDYTSVMVTDRRQLAWAIANWQAHPISHYRIVVDDDCDIEVRDEQVIQNYRSPCKLTVTNLFQIVSTSLEIRWMNGTGCDLMVPYVTFNEITGYPQKIEYSQEQPNLLNIGIKDYLLSNPIAWDRECTFDGWLYSSYTVKTFTPLP